MDKITYYMKRLILLLFLVVGMAKVYSQKETTPKDFDQFSYGFGAGLDYGGLLGTNVSWYFVPNVGIFGAGGYSFPGAGYNFGLKARLRSKNQKSNISPYIIGMYGTNAFVIYKNKYSEEFQSFNGTSFGIGVDFGPKTGRNAFLNFSIIYPIRDSKLKYYDFYPVTLGLGVKFVLSKHK